MGMTTFRQLKEQPAAIYWRRRIVALLIGLSVLALVAWAFAGALGGSAPPAGPAATRPSHPSLADSSPAPGPSHGAAVPPGRPGAGGHAVTSPSAGLTTRTKPAGRGRPVHHGLRPCAAHEVVLSLFSSQASYTVRQTPAFEVDVVSTAGQTCTFDIGASHVLLRISAGSQLIWTSKDCAEGEASLVTKLYRGIPTVVPIAWNGQRSSPGCPVPGAPAAAGSYTAVATDGSLASSPLTFRIG